MLETMEGSFAAKRMRAHDDSGHDLPEYAKDFGNTEAEELVADVLTKKGVIVESVEHGSKQDDYLGKVDLWLKFRGIAEPLGIQYTISDSLDEIGRKKEMLKKKGNLIHKESRGDATIKWPGNANVVLVRGNKEKVARYWEESHRKGVTPAEVVGDEFVRDIFEQVFRQLGEINPIKKDILMKAFAEAYRTRKK